MKGNEMSNNVKHPPYGNDPVGTPFEQLRSRHGAFNDFCAGLNSFITYDGLSHQIASELYSTLIDPPLDYMGLIPGMSKKDGTAMGEKPIRPHYQYASDLGQKVGRHVVDVYVPVLRELIQVRDIDMPKWSDTDEWLEKKAVESDFNPHIGKLYDEAVCEYERCRNRYDELLVVVLQLEYLMARYAPAHYKLVRENFETNPRAMPPHLIDGGGK
jgi:hypothetical protein